MWMHAQACICWSKYTTTITSVIPLCSFPSFWHLWKKCSFFKSNFHNFHLISFIVIFITLSNYKNTLLNCQNSRWHIHVIFTKNLLKTLIMSLNSLFWILFFYQQIKKAKASCVVNWIAPWLAEQEISRSSPNGRYVCRLLL